MMSKEEIKKETKRRIKEVKKRRKKTYTPYILYFCLLGFVIGVGIYLQVNPISYKKKVDVKINHPEVDEVSLIMVGDYLIHSSVYKEANRQAGYKGYNFKPIIAYVKEIVKDYDLAYYNQETILGGTELGLSDYPTFNSPYEAGDAMLDAGFNLVSLATNHTADRGEKAILNSRAYWNKKTDVLAVGSYSSKEERDKVQIKEKNGISYTMLNYTYGTNGMPVSKDYLVNVWPVNESINDPKQDKKYIEYKKQVQKDIEKVKDKVDVLIVAMHWGVEYTHTPTAYEKDMAKFLADLGVNIIIGTHPHVIQPVDYIKDTVVFYSLGNFVSAQYQNENYNKMVGLMPSLTITKIKYNDEVKIQIKDVKADLIYTYYNPASWSGFKVIPFRNKNIAKYLPDYKNVYNTYKNVVQKYQKIEMVPYYN